MVCCNYINYSTCKIQSSFFSEIWISVFRRAHLNVENKGLQNLSASDLTFQTEGQMVEFSVFEIFVKW